MMKYGVKVIFTYSVEPDNRKFYEETIYLVDAESFDDAYKKTEEYTKGFDLERINPKRQKVKTEKKKTRGRFYCLGIEFTRVKSIKFKILVCRFIIFTYNIGSEKIQYSRGF